jgi:hypothetical protein
MRLGAARITERRRRSVKRAPTLAVTHLHHRLCRKAGLASCQIIFTWKINHKFLLYGEGGGLNFLEIFAARVYGNGAA